MHCLKVSNGTPILSLDDPAFRRYGRRIERGFRQLVDWMDGNTVIPDEGNTYVASVGKMEQLTEERDFLSNFYGLLPYEIGYCNGRNSTLNGLEYHKSSEINIAVTDLVLLLGSLDLVEDTFFDVKNVQAFFLQRGDAVELYSTCLHFAPCRVTNDGFKAVVILPRGTNAPLLANRPYPTTSEEKLLFAVNKWLLAHPERKPLMEKGAHPGIVGENIAVLLHG
jgi:hypothetical protein